MEVFYILAVLQVLLGLYALVDGARWLGMIRRRAATHPGFYAPRVALICPCKGVEEGLEQNLAALTEFDYANYEIFFVLASAADPAHEVLRRVASSSKHPVYTVIAGFPDDCGEKVNNLRVAVEQLPADFEVLVFTDSDGRTGRHWLKQLVAPLADTRLGAATTFRWYFPARGGFWSAMATAWNAPIATYLSDHGHNFCWGGGTAIRREVFEKVRVLEFWRGALSDDYTMTRALRQAGRRIHFVPECLVPCLIDLDFHGLLRFTNRQIIITRVCAPGLWLLALLGNLVYCGALLLGLVVLLSTWFSGAPGLHIFLLLLVPPLLAAARGWLRLLAVSELLPAWGGKLLTYGWAWTLLAPLVPFVYLWNCLVAAFWRHITWRGIRYELVSWGQTRILSR